MKNHFTALSLLLGTATLFSSAVHATTPLWFEVEVVLFERLGEKSKEKFVEQIKQFNTENSIKVQDELLYPHFDLCPTLTQFERFNISAQNQIDTQKVDFKETVLIDKMITTSSMEGIEENNSKLLENSENSEIKIVECTAPDDTLLRQAYDLLATRLAAIKQTNEETILSASPTLPLSLNTNTALESNNVQLNNDNGISADAFDPNVFIPYPQRFTFNGIEYSSRPRVILNRVPTRIAQVIEPIPVIDSTNESSIDKDDTADALPALIHTPDRPYLLDKTRLEMTELVQKLRWQKTSTPLLHIGWRQPMVARELAIPVHLFAGKDYSNEYDQLGNNKALMIEAEKQAALVSNQLTTNTPLNDDVLIEQQTQDIQFQEEPQLPSTSIDEIITEVSIKNPVIDTKPIWQLDGLLKIYLNRFLFIEPNFDFRKVEQVKVIAEDSMPLLNSPALANTDEVIEVIDNKPEYVDKLTSHPMSQHRRVRSTEVHYFDHPNMGMIIQIRRFKIPEETQPLSQE